MKKLTFMLLLAAFTATTASAQNAASDTALIKHFLGSLKNAQWNHADMDERYFISLDYAAAKPADVKEMRRYHEQAMQEIQNKLLTYKVNIDDIQYIPQNKASAALLKKVNLAPRIDNDGNALPPTDKGEVYIATDGNHFNVPFLMQQNKIASFCVMRPKGVFLVFL